MRGRGSLKSAAALQSPETPAGQGPPYMSRDPPTAVGAADVDVVVLAEVAHAGERIGVGTPGEAAQRGGASVEQQAEFEEPARREHDRTSLACLLFGPLDAFRVGKLPAQEPAVGRDQETHAGSRRRESMQPYVSTPLFWRQWADR